MSVAVCLIALALGYKVFVDASKEKEGLKLLGQAIGIFVMVAALLASVCATMKCAYKAGCPMTSKASCPTMAKSNCPMSSQAANSQ